MLNNALDYGITEQEFWDMTFAELDRMVASKQRMEKFKAREKAVYDYIHASLIGKAFASCMDNKAKFPEVYEAYPSLFNDEEFKAQREEINNQLSALRFKQFASSHNRRWQEINE